MSEVVYHSVLYSGSETPDTVNLPGSYLMTPAAVPPASLVELDWTSPLQSMASTFFHSIAQVHWRWGFSTRYWQEDTYGEFYFEHLPLVGLLTVTFFWGDDSGVAGTLVYSFDVTAFPWYAHNTAGFSNENDFRNVSYSYPGTQHFRVEGEQTLWEQFVYLRFFGPALTVPPVPPPLVPILGQSGEGGDAGPSSIWRV